MTTGQDVVQTEIDLNHLERFLTFAPAPLTKQTLRGEEEASSLHRLAYIGKDGEEIDLFLGLQKRGVKYLLNGQFGITAELTPFFAEAAVEVWQADTLSATTVVDEFGAFVCELDTRAPLKIRIETEYKVVLMEEIKI